MAARSLPFAVRLLNMQIFPSKNITIEPGFCLLIAASLLVFPPNWVIAWLAAAAFHELCHCLALWFCGATIYAFRLGLNGTVIDTESLSVRQELLSALAGPLGGWSLFLFLRLAPQLAICALLQTLYNILPIYPLDGGRAILCCAELIMGRDQAFSFCRYFGYIILALLFIGACFVTVFLKIGLLPIGIVLLLSLKSRSLKTPCKQSKQIVQ